MSQSLRVHGKCILLGEHSVVRGAPALVWPLTSKGLTLRWEHSPGAGLTAGKNDYSEAFLGALRHALSFIGRALPGKWEFSIESDIPVRAGLGSSAALSVAITQFLQRQKLYDGDPFALALELENIFHGKSSGIDVAATLSASPIQFQRGKPPEALELAWEPRLYLSDSGLRSATKACVEQVSRMERPDLDARMAAAVGRAREALANPNGFGDLATALNEAGAVFEAWKLIPEEVKTQIGELRKAGARSVKPTGSGNGGFVLSLWDQVPPAGLGLIAVAGDSSRAL